MNPWTRIVLVTVLITSGAYGYVPLGSAQEGKSIDQMIAEAKTPADHETIATYYDREGQAAHEKQVQHQKMGAMYAKRAKAGPKRIAGSVAHCMAIAGQFEYIAKEYEALAQMHRTMATSALEQK